MIGVFGIVDEFLYGVAGQITMVVLICLAAWTFLGWAFASRFNRPAGHRPYRCIVLFELVAVWLLRGAIAAIIIALDSTVWGVLFLVTLALMVFYIIPTLILESFPATKDKNPS